jgi:hypothetical protein
MVGHRAIARRVDDGLVAERRSQQSRPRDSAAVTTRWQAQRTRSTIVTTTHKAAAPQPPAGRVPTVYGGA